MSEHARIAKFLLDTKRADDLPAAVEALGRTRVQIVLGPAVSMSETLQTAALLTADVARRAFPGGVTAVMPDDASALTNWTAGDAFSTALQRVGAELRETPDPRLPTVALGGAALPTTAPVAITAVPRGWAGGAVGPHQPVPDWRPGPLGAVAAGAIAVSEVFAAVHGLDPRAGRRSVGLSAWAPDSHWAHDTAVGPELAHLPKALWLLGLGHLGQAYAWLLRALPYADASAVLVGLQDFDTVDEENFATQLLCDSDNIWHRKTRAVAHALEGAGLTTTIVERPFDRSHRRRSEEPAVALIGLDDDAPRRLLSGVGWAQVINVGLGARAGTFTQVVLHRVGGDAARLFADREPDTTVDRLVEDVPAYQRLAETDRCGAVIAAGRAVGTAFVGAAASVMVLAELLRPLYGGPASDAWRLNLRFPDDAHASLRQAAATDLVRATTPARTLRETSSPSTPPP